MKRRLSLGVFIFLGFLLVLTNSVSAQNSYKLVGAESSIKITGTSTLHDWHMDVTKMNCSVNANFNEKQNLIVQFVDFKCQVVDIKSDNTLMDSKAHDALKASDHKTITFNSNSNSELAINGGTLNGKFEGDLTIAGLKKKVLLPFNGEIDNNVVKLDGELKIKMSDFKMKPPTAMMGTIKTGDEVVIKYTLVFR